MVGTLLERLAALRALAAGRGVQRHGAVQVQVLGTILVAGKLLGDVIGFAVFVEVIVLGITARLRHRLLDAEKRREEQERERRRVKFQYPGDPTELPPSITDLDAPDPKIKNSTTHHPSRAWGKYD